MLPFRNRALRADAISDLGDRMKAKIALVNQADQAPEEPTADEPPSTSDEEDIWLSLDRNVAADRSIHRTQPSGSPHELLQYLNLPNCDRKKWPNPIEYLETIKGMYPTVYALAREILPIMATSTPCERLCSHAGLILTQLRSRLSGHRLDELIFLRSVDERDWFPPA
ncbi:Flavin-dependent thymidylate synthase [Frankliniella fusca]|uniref:Flavin-dependent thymidylate synthase n=1 Tax=Frankliniella fusca TaxID=407009 RepID=A0AAE1LEZ1_9NEOP|nr:Flavin-dependent thymidylate synthase [Frankliniella fusca]